MKNICCLLILMLTMSVPTWAQSSNPSNITHSPVDITASHPTAFAVGTGADSNSVILTFGDGFVPVGLEWSDSLGKLYTYTKFDSVTFYPYPAFSAVPSGASAISANKFDATYGVLNLAGLDTGVATIEKFRPEVAVTQWYMPNFYWLVDFRGTKRTNNENWFRKSVYVVGYTSNKTH